MEERRREVVVVAVVVVVVVKRKRISTLQEGGIVKEGGMRNMGDNLYNCMNSYWSICIQKLAKKRFASRLGFQPGTNIRA